MARVEITDKRTLDDAIVGYDKDGRAVKAERLTRGVFKVLEQALAQGSMYIRDDGHLLRVL